MEPKKQVGNTTGTNEGQRDRASKTEHHWPKTRNFGK